LTRIAQSLIGTRGFTAASQEACGTNRPGSETTSADATYPYPCSLSPASSYQANGIARIASGSRKPYFASFGYSIPSCSRYVLYLDESK